jgi:hypothetical protein
MDAKMDGDGLTDLSEMRDFLNELLTNQLSTV